MERKALHPPQILRSLSWLRLVGFGFCRKKGCVFMESKHTAILCGWSTPRGALSNALKIRPPIVVVSGRASSDAIARRQFRLGRFSYALL